MGYLIAFLWGLGLGCTGTTGGFLLLMALQGYRVRRAAEEQLERFRQDMDG